MTGARRQAFGVGSVIAAAALVRGGLFTVTSLILVLERRPELTSPLTSFRSREWMIRH